jgi:hypothetical protein
MGVSSQVTNPYGKIFSIVTGDCGEGACPVGASLLAMEVNDNAYFLNKRVALESIASKLAPTK